MNWERVFKRYEELENSNHSTYADFELAIIFGEYDLAEYLEGAMELNKQQGYFTGQQSQDIYKHCKPYRLYQRLLEKTDSQVLEKAVFNHCPVEC